MVDEFIHKNLADKRKEIQAYIGSLERDPEQARRELSSIIATERGVSIQRPQGDGLHGIGCVIPAMRSPVLSKPHLLPVRTAWSRWTLPITSLLQRSWTANRHLRRSIGYKVVQVLSRWEKVRKVTRLKKLGTVIVWWLIEGRNQC